MKKICVVTATRAEYGLLKPLLIRLIKHEQFDMRLVVTGAHLSEKFGYTYKEIENDGVAVVSKIPILSYTMSKTMGKALAAFEKYFEEDRPDALILLGDRYETMAIACAATNARIPIFHLYGGDTTEGAIDEAYRHSITKMSLFHFVSCERSRKRVIQMGESPGHVFNVGALAVENAISEPLMTLEELEENVGISLRSGYAVVTFHPVTLENNTCEEQCEELLAALSHRNDLSYIITKSNADAGGDIINDIIDRFGREKETVFITESLGMRRYLSSLKYASMVIGNSSSGIYEAPIFKVPTINIGDRQRGRTQTSSIINCEPHRDEIVEAMMKAEESAFRESLKDMELPYGDGRTSEKIIRILETEFLNNEVDLKKNFYDVQFYLGQIT